MWDSKRAPGRDGAEECYTLSDALAVAIWLNIFVRNSKDLGMCTLAQSVNVISPLMTSPTGICKQTTYWPLLLFAKYMQGKAIAVNVKAKAYTGPTTPEWVESTCIVPMLDVSAARDGEWINLAVVNSDKEKSFDTELTGVDPAGEVNVYMVGGEQSALTDVNMEGSEKVKIRESKWSADKKFVFEKHSFTLLRWRVKS